MEVGQRAGRSSTGASRRCSTAPAEALIAAGLSGAWRWVGKTTPWTPAASALRSSVPTFCGSSSESSDEHERRLAALDRAGEDVVERRPAARLDDERDALVAVEAGERRQRAALDLDDRDPQARRVEHDLLERLPPLRHDQQPDRRPAGDERLLDRPAAGDELLVLAEQLRIGSDGRSTGPNRSPKARPAVR